MQMTFNLHDSTLPKPVNCSHHNTFHCILECESLVRKAYLWKEASRTCTDEGIDRPKVNPKYKET